MNRINFLQTGGFPTDLDTYDFMQSSYIALQKMALALAGDKPCIVTGCEIAGPTVSEGWVIVDGELLPMATQTLGTNVAVIEDLEQVTFEDGNSKDAYIRRRVEFSVSGTIPWADFVRLPVLAQSESKLRKQLENIVDFLNRTSAQTMLTTVTVTKTGNDYTHTAGSICYDGKVYTVDALAVALTDTGTPKFAVDTNSIYEDKLKLVLSTDPDGLFVYTAATKHFGEWQSSTSTTGATVTSPTGTVTALTRRWKELPGNLILLNFALSVNLTGSSTILSLGLPLPVAGKDYQHEYAVATVEMVNQSRHITATIKRINNPAASLLISCTNTAMTGNAGVYGQLIYEKG